MKGVYKLVFKELEDFPYIGFSVDIDRRFRDHINSLKAGRSNYKLQEAFEISGIPTLEILEETGDISRESYWIKYYDSINNGLNITSGSDSSGSGYNHTRSKYTREQLIEVLELLQDPFNSYQNIADQTKVSYSVVYEVSRGSSHQWIKDEFPDKAKRLEELYGNRRTSIKDWKPVFVSPEGEDISEYDSLKELCEIFNLTHSSMVDLALGKMNIHKGWTLKSNTNYYPTIQDPSGGIHRIRYGELSKFVAARENMTKQGLDQLVKGKSKTYKGWKLYREPEHN